MLIRIENVDRSGAGVRKCYTMNAHDAVVKYPFLCEPFDYDSRDFSFARVCVRLWLIVSSAARLVVRIIVVIVAVVVPLRYLL